MKQTLSTHEIARLLVADTDGGWSYAGALALAEHLEGYEEDAGEEIEFDRVALRCDYSEHSSLIDWADGYFCDWETDSALGIEPEDDEDEQEEKIREHIRDNGELIEFEGGVIVSSF